MQVGANEFHQQRHVVLEYTTHTVALSLGDGDAQSLDLVCVSLKLLGVKILENGTVRQLEFRINWFGYVEIGLRMIFGTYGMHN